MLKKNCSIPFKLGDEKAINPFLSSESGFYNEFKSKKNFSNLQMFTFLRDLKNKY